ncbi:hypothetical protein GGF43_006345 [Coemansia sp. RSA 2618]|nr:hypothetical protein GGF43_006345 [Coemansia sp. RSA 2618]
MSQYLVPRAFSTRAFSARAFSTGSPTPKARGWRKYLARFRDRPASHITAFAVLHEITAIAPLAAVYYTLDYFSPKTTVFPDHILNEGNRFIGKLRAYVGLEQLDPASPVLAHLVTSYAIVKAAAPVRIAASVAMTPWVARWCVVPVAKVFERMWPKALRKNKTPPK